MLKKLFDLVTGKGNEEPVDMNLGRGSSVLQLDENSIEYAAYDGVTHINVDFHTAKTELGRMLSHANDSSFNHPAYGPFRSMEGFWSWARTGMKHDHFRYNPPAECRAWVRNNRHECVTLPDFRYIVIEANYHRVMSNAKLTELMRQSIEKFDMYYLRKPNTVDGDDHKIITRPAPSEWLIVGFEYIRECIQNDVSFNRQVLEKRFEELVLKNIPDYE